jgi:hypothetical protein
VVGRRIWRPADLEVTVNMGIGFSNREIKPVGRGKVTRRGMEILHCGTLMNQLLRGRLRYIPRYLVWTTNTSLFNSDAELY